MAAQRCREDFGIVVSSRLGASSCRDRTVQTLALQDAQLDPGSKNPLAHRDML